MDSEFIKLLSEMASMPLDANNPADALAAANRLEEHTLSDLAQHDAFPDLQNNPSGIRMPAYLKEQIIRRTSQPDMQIRSTPRRFSKRMELFLYSCKVTAAVAACLMMVITFSMLQGSEYSLSKQTESLLETNIMENTINSIVTQLNNGSRNITLWLQNVSVDITGNKK